MASNATANATITPPHNNTSIIDANNISIRPATLDDIQSIVDITNEAIENSLAIWTSILDSVEKRTEWYIQRTMQYQFPVLVACYTHRHDNSSSSSIVVGYGSYGYLARGLDKEGYMHTVEHSIYVSPSMQHHGIGKMLLTALIDYAKRQRYVTHLIHSMIGGIESSNVASIRLHERCGFKEQAFFKEVGRKFNKWLDLRLYQLMIDDDTNDNHNDKRKDTDNNNNVNNMNGNGL